MLNRVSGTREWCETGVGVSPLCFQGFVDVEKEQMLEFALSLCLEKWRRSGKSTGEVVIELDGGVRSKEVGRGRNGCRRFQSPSPVSDPRAAYSDRPTHVRDTDLSSVATTKRPHPSAPLVHRPLVPPPSKPGVVIKLEDGMSEVGARRGNVGVTEMIPLIQASTGIAAKRVRVSDLAAVVHSTSDRKPTQPPRPKTVIKLEDVMVEVGAVGPV